MEFKRPGKWHENGIYPDQAGMLIEELRRFIGHDELMRRVANYKSPKRSSTGVGVARLRDHQPLIEAFECYEKLTRHRQRGLRSVPMEIADLAHVAAHYGVVGPTLGGSVARNHKQRLISLDGQLRPLLLEWKMASHFSRSNKADISWLDVGATGPEFIVRGEGVEWEVECKFQSSMVTELLGLSEADRIATEIIAWAKAKNLRGRLALTITDVPRIDGAEGAPLLGLTQDMTADDLPISFPAGMILSGDLRACDGLTINVDLWHEELREHRSVGARIYAQSGVSGRNAVDPIELHIVAPKRHGNDLLDYLWDRKFSKAAQQCTGQRGAMLAFEWGEVDDPEIFQESDIIRELIERTFREFRHVAVIAMRCNGAPSRYGGLIDYAVGAYLAKSTVTAFPEVADIVRLDG